MKRNNDMKHLSYHYIMALLAACLLSVAMTGCTADDDGHTTDGRTATIRLDIPKFTLIGATTRTGLLTGPLRDRFGIAFRLHV